MGAGADASTNAAAANEEVPCGGGDGADGSDVCDANDGAQDDANPPSADELKGRWERHRKHLAWLDEEGFDEDDPIRKVAADQAAAAERAWRDASPGVVVTQRLVWAEQGLRRARRVQANQEQAIDEYDRWYEQERLAMLSHLGDLRARTREYELRLAAISRQAAEEYHAPGAEAEDDGNVDGLREAVDTLEGEVAPGMRELLAMAPEGSPLRAKVSEVMGSITTVYSLTTSANRNQRATRYNIAGGADEETWEDADEGYYDDGWAAHGEGGHWWRDNQWRDNSAAWGGGGEPYGESAMDTRDVQVPRWIRTGGGDGTVWDQRAWKRGRRMADDPNGLQGRHLDAAEATPEHEAAVQLQARLTDAATGAAVATSAAVQLPTPPASDTAEAEALERRKRAVWDAAQNEGVEISCEAIAQMDAHVLEEWAAAHLQEYGTDSLL